MDVTIIIPIYNTEVRKIKRCICSIERLKATSSFNIECIIVDDGSDDYVENYIKSFARNRNCYKYIKKQNGGVSSARNVGIEQANGKYILFVDSDDAIIVDNASKLIAQYLDSDADLVFSDMLVNYGGNKTVWEAFPFGKSKISISDVLCELSKSEKINGPVCKLIRTDYIRENNITFPEDMAHGEDAVFLYCLLKYDPQVAYYKALTYIYHLDNDNYIGRVKKDPGQILKDTVLLYEKYMQLLISSKVGMQHIKVYAVNRTQMYIKNLFFYKVDLCFFDLHNEVLEKTLKRSACLTGKYKLITGKIYKGSFIFRKHIIVNNNRIICDIIAHVRNYYQLVKRKKNEKSNKNGTIRMKTDLFG